MIWRHGLDYSNHKLHRPGDRHLATGFRYLRGPITMQYQLLY